MRFAAVLLTIFGLLTLPTGCGGDKEKGKQTADNHDDHNHGSSDHIGGNNPHKIIFKDAPFNALWEHAGDLVTFHIVDNEFKAETAIAADEIVISDNEEKNIIKVPASEKNEKGEAMEFELDDKKLATIMDHDPKMTIKVGDKSYTTIVKHIH